MGYSNWSDINVFTTKASDGISGVEQVKLTGGTIDEYFGTAVSLNSVGDTVAISSSSGVGYVKVYKNVANIWTLQGSKIDGEAISQSFGGSISINSAGDTVIIGAYAANSSTGYAKVYKLISGIWTLQGAKILGEGTGNFFGISVSINGPGDIIAIGAAYANSYKGYVKVYKLISGAWTLQGTRIDGEAANDYFGIAISINSVGDTVAIGAVYGASFKGYVKIYKNISGTWTLQGSRINGEVSSEYFGTAVSLNSIGDIVAIGASDSNSSTGYAKVYKNISNTWTLQGAKLIGEVSYDKFGCSVSISGTGDIVAIGANRADNYKGYVKIYKFASDSWTLQGAKLTGENTGDRFGSSVSINSTGITIAIGASYANSSTGYVKVYT